jgi:hypothetical protein
VDNTAAMVTSSALRLKIKLNRRSIFIMIPLSPNSNLTSSGLMPMAFWKTQKVLLEAISKLGFSFEIKKCPRQKNIDHRSRFLLSRPAERIFQPDGRDQGEKTFLRWLLIILYPPSP